MDFKEKVKRHLREEDKAELYTTDVYECPECGYSGDPDDFGNECPECGEDADNMDSYSTAQWECPHCGETNEADSFTRKGQKVTCDYCKEESTIS